MGQGKGWKKMWVQNILLYMHSLCKRSLSLVTEDLFSGLCRLDIGFIKSGSWSHCSGKEYNERGHWAELLDLSLPVNQRNKLSYLPESFTLQITQTMVPWGRTITHLIYHPPNPPLRHSCFISYYNSCLAAFYSLLTFALDNQLID